MNKKRQHSSKRCYDPEFQQRLHVFIASKADLLLQRKGKQSLKRGIDSEKDSAIEVLDLYAKVPPLEVFMKIPHHVRRCQIFQLLDTGDIVLGEVSSKRPFGIFVELKGFEFGKTRDFTNTDIQALCRTNELQDDTRHKDPSDKYVVGDKVRGVVLSVNKEDNQVTIALRPSRLPSEFQDIKLGLIEESESFVSREIAEDEEELHFNDHLRRHMGFNNPRNIETLLDKLGITMSDSCSFLRSCQRSTYPSEDYAEPLRKKQSEKWSMESTAKGIEHFKIGDANTALKYLEHALQINPDNVEALVARGALTANTAKYSPAIMDFRRALSINKGHRNATRYLVETLIQKGTKEEKGGHLSAAVTCFREACVLDKGQQMARKLLDKCQMVLDARQQKRQSAPGPSSAPQHRENASKFSHVRELIQMQQDKKKKKKKKKERRKQKTRVKSGKKRQTKTRRRSRRSSSDESSDESTSTASEGSDESSSESKHQTVHKRTREKGQWKLTERSISRGSRGDKDDMAGLVQEFVSGVGRRVSGPPMDGQPSPPDRTTKKRSRTHSRSRSRSRVRSRSRSLSRSRNRSRTRSRPVSRDGSRTRSHPVSRDGSRTRSRSVLRDGSRTRSRSVLRDRSRIRSRSVSRDSSRTRTRSVSRGRSRFRSRPRIGSKSRFRSNRSPRRSRDISHSWTHDILSRQTKSRPMSPKQSRSIQCTRSRSRSRSSLRTCSRSRSRSQSRSSLRVPKSRIRRRHTSQSDSPSMSSGSGSSRRERSRSTSPFRPPSSAPKRRRSADYTKRRKGKQK
ncbi:tetratricopeptide repeat protein 14 isoform X2 [Nematostella vectensis]|nr:tetratricopeptide repeat protein 14 isoform X2 [Nematostella vectensis]XP_048585118.1 tetratricopeptide repeat protein 14 isoform X2 [Nematostella vectensis]XP_048585119.1 tetratricopeptide repeat protein 14 isoform X2 [Nematostella vectensis]XP_048585120.1 tetratricopeptide repeat protein 14 isoform X2 [Nematostella vectensis]XP_048585121.1 tetratricopeptide repeat protein 14 isoform X2 [Nematostella vectensis]XP_048585122.1 tetratricopeptide repeat protein 14 isoform X2 [Nematostella vect